MLRASGTRRSAAIKPVKNGTDREYQKCSEFGTRLEAKRGFILSGERERGETTTRGGYVSQLAVSQPVQHSYKLGSLGRWDRGGRRIIVIHVKSALRSQLRYQALNGLLILGESKFLGCIVKPVCLFPFPSFNTAPRPVFKFD